MSNELISHQNNQAENIAKFFETNERLEDTSMRRDYFEHLDENEFIDLVQQIASLVRTGDLANHAFDGNSAALLGHEVPDQREKEQLLRDTWAVAKDFLADSQLTDQDALDYAAMTVAGGLLYAHPFADGNGRTTRSLTYMMARGTANQQQLHDLLAESDGGGNWQVAPIPIVMGERSSFKGNQPAQIEWEEAWAGEADDALGGIIVESSYRDEIIRSFIEKYSQQVESQLKASSVKGSDDQLTLKADEFINQLVNDPQAGITNASELLKIHRQTRANYVHRFLQAMQLKQAVEPYKINSNDLKIKPDDNELLRNRKQVIIEEFGRRAIDGLITVADQQLIRHRSHSRIRYSELDK